MVHNAENHGSSKIKSGNIVHAINILVIKVAEEWRRDFQRADRHKGIPQEIADVDEDEEHAAKPATRFRSANQSAGEWGKRMCSALAQG